MTLGFQMANRHDRLDLLHCTLALKGLAKFHAASVALYDKNANCMDDYVEIMYTEKNRDAIMGFLAPSINALANVVEKWSGFEKYGDKLRLIIPTICDRIMKIVKPFPDSLSVLTHGDFWVNNMMFHYCPETGKPDQVRFIDFQMTRYTSPVLDLQYFIHTSTNEQVRSEYTEHLLQVYHTELQDTLKTLGCDQHIYTFEQLKEEYEDRSLFGLITACTVLSAVLADPEEAFDMENVKEDVSQMDSKFIEKPYSGRRYREALQKLLPHFERKGLL
jgi:RecA/RadA recombinase